jgi:hypothetical protein
MKSKIRCTRTAILVLFSFFVLTLSAQNQKTNYGKDVTYQSVFTMDYSFDPLNSEVNDSKYKKLTVNASDGGNVYLEKWILAVISEGSKSGLYTCYEDIELSKPIPEETISTYWKKTSTFTTFDLKTYEEKVEVVEEEILLNAIQGLRCKQVLFYDEKEDQFFTQLLAVAPLIKDSNENTVKPIYWIKMDTPLPSGLDLKDKNIVWSVETYAKNTNFYLEKEGVDTPNSNASKGVFLDLFYEKTKHPASVIELDYYGSDNFNTKDDPLTITDTIISFDLETYQELKKPINRRIEPDCFRLVQEWYYDTKRNKLYNKLKAIGPVQVVNNEMGNSMYQTPLFYLRLDE